MKILDRYIGAVIGRHFVYVLAALLAIFSVLNLTEELRLADTPTYGVGQALRFVVLTLPAEAYGLFATAALLATVLALGQLLAQNEIVAIHAAGVSPARLTGTVLMAAATLAVMGAALGELVAAPLSQGARRHRALALSGGRTLSTSAGLWLRDGSRFVNIGQVHPDGSLGEVYVFDFSPQPALERFIYAREAAPQGGTWMLKDLQESTVAQDVVSTRRLEAQAWDAQIDPQRLRAFWLQPEDLSVAELYRTMQTLRQQRQNPASYELAFWRRATAPVYTTVMVLLAVPIVAIAGRGRRRGERIVLAVLIGLGFQLFQQALTNVGVAAGLPMLMTALLPAAVAALTAAALFRWQAAP